MLVGALGDIHGDFEAVRRIMTRHREVPGWVCVGDVADGQGRYEALPAPLYWIKGNNENFDAIADGRLPENLHYMMNARPWQVGEVRCAGLGGTLAPTWYESAAADLPHPGKRTSRATELADKRRHFVREEVEACRRLRGVDLFLSHEAPRPFRIGRLDAGKGPINEVLAAMRPRLHLFGHHHRFAELRPEGVKSIGLDLAARSYLLLDARSLEYQKLDAGR